MNEEIATPSGLAMTVRKEIASPIRLEMTIHSIYNDLLNSVFANCSSDMMPVSMMIFEKSSI